MAQTSTYKQLSHLPRYLTQESALNGGVVFTDNAIDEGRFRMIANAEYDDIKGCLVSRKGLQRTTTAPILLHEAEVDKDTPEYFVLGEYPLLVWGVRAIEGPIDGRTYYAREKDIYTSCVLCAPLNASKDAYDCNNLRVLIKEGAGYESASVKTIVQNEHGVYFQAADDSEMTIKKQVGDNNTAPVATYFQNTLYVLGYDQDKKSQLKRLQACYRLDNGDYLFSLSSGSDVYDVPAGEAVSNGYNMLKGESAYTFNNKPGEVWSIDGIIPRDPNDNSILLSTRTNQAITFSLIYSYPTTAKGTYSFKWEWASSSVASDNTAWAIIKEVDATPGQVVSVPFTATASAFMVRVTVYPKDDADNIIAVGMTTLDGAIDRKTRAELNTYDLATATGMTGWEGRLVLWGVDNADSILFTSDINNPSYFPYPNNVHIFDKPIVHAVNYMDGLLVFTTERIYLLSLSSDGLSFSVNAVQNRLNFNRNDAQYIQVIKNMVFFKTDDYFYMVVPKATSLTGELTIAPIYKAMAAFFNDPDTALEKDIVKEVYIKPLVEADAYHGKDVLESKGLQYTYVDQNTVRLVYQVKAKLSGITHYISVVLNYDTTTRVWTFHTYETNGRPTVAQYQLSTSEAPLLNIYRENNNEYLQILKYTNGEHTDAFALNDGQSRMFKNILFIDTGYHNMDAYASFKKRFREIQFKVFPTANTVLEFGTAFLLDGCTRKDYKVYNTVAEGGVLYLGKLDVNSDAFVYNGNVLSCTLFEDMTVPYDTTITDVLANSTDTDSSTSDCTALGAWRIGLSALREPTAVTFRQPVSGKGLLPRFKLLGFREMPVELDGINWVYHLMNGR